MLIDAGIDLVIGPPPIPSIVMAPEDPSLVIVPVAGPQGPKGDTGDSSTSLAYTYTTSNPAMLHQIHHNLPFNPGGVTCLDSSDGLPLLGFTVAHPSVGITEVTFGVAVTPTIFLS
jgi:hypothetical protein